MLIKLKIELLFIALTGIACAQTTIDPTSRYAYGANIGWIDVGDATYGMVVGEFYCSGYLYSANCGWIDLGDGSPDNHMAYGNDSAADFGVNHDGQGLLTGYAYGANIGWVVFEQTYGRPQVDLRTGDLLGYVWSPNVGWIALNGVKTINLASGEDTDADQIPDAWEYQHVGTLTPLSATGDNDSDGVFDRDEYLADTDPDDAGDYLRITNLELTEGGQTVTWTCRPSRYYSLEYAASLQTNWVKHSVVYYPAWPTTSDAIKGGPTAASRFYQVKAFRPFEE